jgi:hypothetical protein
VLHNAGVLDLLKPLLVDNVPSVQHYASLAIGRLCSQNEQFAKSVAANDILPQLVFTLQEQGVCTKFSTDPFHRKISKNQPLLF